MDDDDALVFKFPFNSKTEGRSVHIISKQFKTI